MAPPVPRTTGTNVLISEFRNLGVQGWTENYIINVGDTENPLERALLLHQPLLASRQLVSSVSVALKWVRASEINVGNDSLLVSGAEIATPLGNRAGDPADPDIGWMVRFQDISGQIRDMHMWRGWAALDVPYLLGVIQGAVPNAAKTFLQRAINVMTKPLVPDGGAAGRYVIKSFARPGTLEVTLLDAIAFGFTATGEIKFRIFNPGGLTLPVGSIIKLHVVRKRCFKGLSGEAKVIAIDTTSEAYTEITIDKKLCCPPAALTGLVGKVIKKVVAYYDIARGQITSMRKRKAGRPFGSIPGRRRGRCC
ncbi:MAG: hypothetical protein EHM18_03295 [Acidobacteria bacterium]|nr:MAG: hypothetical protein EHM18_03295 [Acidobacteriota bacterium]